jgi:hypothetical protein
MMTGASQVRYSISAQDMQRYAHLRDLQAAKAEHQ